MSDFNTDLLKYGSNIDSSNFLDKTYSSFPLSYILSPSRLTTRSQTLIDNIFSNNIEEDINSRILTSKISDHYVQFLLFGTTKKRKTCHRKIQRSFKSINEEKFKRELNWLVWPNVLRINNNNVDLSFDLFYENVSKLILKHTSLKKLRI